jgi:hypothetical protein
VVARVTCLQAVDVCWPDVYVASTLCQEAREYADWLVEEARKEGTPPLTVSSKYAQPFRVQVSTADLLPLLPLDPCASAVLWASR